LFLYLRPRIGGRFKRVCAAAVKDADVVFLEYPFWAKPLSSLCSACSKRLILTNHDQAWKSWTSYGLARRFGAELLKKLEVSAMRSADRCVVVSTADRDAFAAMGVDAVVIPNAVDCEVSPVATASSLGAKWEIIRGSAAALFVGGGWFPNQVAVARICHDIAPRLPEVAFYVIGRCTDGFFGTRPSNVLFLQGVDSADLEGFYSLADVVVIPISEGTGTSLKAVEALSRGKAVVSTSVGVRDLPVVSGVHALVEDDFSKYPEVIRGVLADTSRRASLELSARQVMLRYDYRTVYRPYLDMIDQSMANHMKRSVR
jgi:glycosyltransferase involved in cell wall biosynthesis